MTTQEIAKLAGVSTTYVRECCRSGHINGRKRPNPLGYGPEIWDWDENVVPILVKKKAEARARMLHLGDHERWNSVVREECSRHGVPCVLQDLKSTCSSCPRDRKYELANVVCGAMADIEVLGREK